MRPTLQSFLKIPSVNLLIFSLFILPIGCTATVENPQQVDTGTVSLSIAFPAVSQRDDINVEIGCSTNTTVFEVMRRAQTDGVFEFKHSSSPLEESMVFVKSIGGVGGDDGQFWTYYVNNELAQEGCGTCSAKPGDSIRWVYGLPPAELN